MAKIEFGIEHLVELGNGEVVKLFNRAMVSVIEDCKRRPNEKRKRKVQLTLLVEPVATDDVLHSIDTDFDVKFSVPARQSSSYRMAVRALKGGEVVPVINPESPRDPHQGTLDEATAE